MDSVVVVEEKRVLYRVILVEIVCISSEPAESMLIRELFKNKNTDIYANF